MDNFMDAPRYTVEIQDGRPMLFADGSSVGKEITSWRSDGESLVLLSGKTGTTLTGRNADIHAIKRSLAALIRSPRQNPA